MPWPSEGISLSDSEFAEIKAELAEELPPGVTLDDYLAESGTTESELRTQMAVRKMIIAKAEAVAKPSDDEIQAFYAENKEGFAQDESVTASHILIKTERTDTEESKAAKRERLLALRQQLLDGADFRRTGQGQLRLPQFQRGRRSGLLRPRPDGARIRGRRLFPARRLRGGNRGNPVRLAPRESHRTILRPLTPRPPFGTIPPTMKTKFSPIHSSSSAIRRCWPNFPLHAPQVVSSVPPLQLDIEQISRLSDEDITLFEALQIETARLAIESVASLSKINEVDHMGGGLDLIPPLLLTLSLVDRAATDFTIENAHTSIGYFSALATLGYLDRQQVIDFFRRGLDIPGHVSWVPGGTQLNGGRLGVMIPTAVGQALGKRAAYGSDAWVLCHTGDAGWIAGHALNGFHAARIHKAPVTFIMHRNGIQLSGTTRQMTGTDPRPIIEALGIQILETPSLYDVGALWQTLREAHSLARNGIPSLIFPTGKTDVPLAQVGERFGIGETCPPSLPRTAWPWTPPSGSRAA
jgi:transketolase N-terminal domain/subunit